MTRNNNKISTLYKSVSYIFTLLTVICFGHVMYVIALMGNFGYDINTIAFGYTPLLGCVFMITSLVLSIRFFNVALFFIPLIAIISYIWAEVEARAIIKDPTPDTILILDDNDKQEVKVKHMINLGNNVVGLTKFGDDDYRAVTYGYVKNMKAID